MPTLDAEQHKKLDRVLHSAARWKRKSTEDHNGVEAPAARAARLARGGARCTSSSRPTCSSR